jgi:hypothetical protein
MGDWPRTRPLVAFRERLFAAHLRGELLDGPAPTLRELRLHVGSPPTGPGAGGSTAAARTTPKTSRSEIATASKTPGHLSEERGPRPCAADGTSNATPWSRTRGDREVLSSAAPSGFSDPTVRQMVWLPRRRHRRAPARSDSFRRTPREAAAGCGFRSSYVPRPGSTPSDGSARRGWRA